MPNPRDQMIADAKNLPELLQTARAADPALFAMLTGGNVKNVWYAPAVSGVAWLAAHYEFGWDPDTCAAVAGLFLFAGVGIYHLVARRFVPPPAGPAVVALLAAGLSLTACGQTATQQASGIRSGVEAAGCLLDTAGHVVAVVQVPAGTAQKALVAAGAAGAVLSTDPMCPAALNDGLAAAPRG